MQQGSELEWPYRIILSCVEITLLLTSHWRWIALWRAVTLVKAVLLLRPPCGATVEGCLPAAGIAGPSVKGDLGGIHVHNA